MSRDTQYIKRITRLELCFSYLLCSYVMSWITIISKRILFTLFRDS